jgi:preprotein translocase subunit SecG
MFSFVVVVHVFVCILLILIVLLQTGKGAEIGAVLGGSGSETLFGSTGATTFLNKLTTVIAIVFMVTSLILAYMSGHRHTASIMLDSPAPIEQKTSGEKAVQPGMKSSEPAETSGMKTESETPDPTRTTSSDDHDVETDTTIP